MNSVGKVIKSFKHELKDIYPLHEIKSITELVFEHYFNFSETELITRTDIKLTDNEINSFKFVLERLKTHEPIQYILGETLFYDLRFHVKPGVLIPRQETEELVDWTIKQNRNSNELQVLDIGTGSGCIAVALAANLNKAYVFAYDISDKAIEIAKRNAKLNQLDIHFVKKDILLSYNVTENQQFDIIVSNPPYVLEKERDLMAKNVLDYEPELALFVEDSDPLIFYRAIINYSKLNLKADGKLYFEINEAYGLELEKLMNKSGFEKVQLRKDINGKHRMIAGKKV